MAALGDCLEELGAEYAILSCDDSSVVQGMQIDNFISQGCDLIMIHPSDASTVEDLCAAARAKGSIGFEGSDEDTARGCASMFALILADRIEAKNVFRSFTPLDSSTVDTIIAGMK